MRLAPRMISAAAVALVVAACSAGGAADTTVTTAAPTAPPPTSAPPATLEPTTTSTTTTTTTTTTPPPEPLTLLSNRPVTGAGGGHLYSNPGAMLYVDGGYHMYRNSFSAWPGPSEVHHLTSADGVTWEQQSVVLTTDDVPFTTGNAFVMEVVPEPDGWVAYFYTYEGLQEPGFIGRATADDLDGPWTVEPAPILGPGPGQSWDGLRVIEPTVAATDEGYVMYYAGIGADGASAIGMATSADGVTWERSDTPVFTGDPEGWNLGSVGCPDVARLGDGWVMVFDSSAGTRGHGVATSDDGMAWQQAEEPILTQDNSPLGNAIWQSELLEVEDEYLFYVEIGPAVGPTTIYGYVFDPFAVP